MNNEELRSRIGNNIARLRKDRGLTQAELAERINYSDKAVSKWERGESTPDVLTLMNLAEQLGADLNTLTGASDAAGNRTEPEPVPEPPVRSGEKQTTSQRIEELTVRYKADKGVIQKLSSILVWVVALFVYMVLDAFRVRHLWMVFVVAIPANAIVLLSLRSAWKLYGWNRILISVIMWSCLLIIYLLLWLCCQVNVWRILPMGLLGQTAILLWFKMFRPIKEDDHE